MSEINEFLKALRERRKLTLREAADRSGLSHSYISSLENGRHPKTKAPINPSPESLERLSEAYNYDYELLMKIAGYIKRDETDDSLILNSTYEQAIREAKVRYGVNLRDDPVANATIRELLLSIAKQKTTENK